MNVLNLKKKLIFEVVRVRLFLEVLNQPKHKPWVRKTNHSKMQRISELSTSDIGKIVTIAGWVESIRYQKKLVFFELRFGALKRDTIQCVSSGASLDVCSLFCKDSYVELSVLIKKVPDGHSTLSGIECEIQSVKHESPSCTDITTRVCSTSGPETKFKERHLYVRELQMRQYAALTSLVLSVLRKTFESFDCEEILPPLFGSVKCEGGSDVFTMDHLGTPVYMTQSSQMYLEAMVPVQGPVYCIQPSFRAEKSHTRRHLTCFTHAECELSGFDSFDAFVEFLQEFVKRFLQRLIKKDKKGILEEIQRKKFVEAYLTKGFKVLSHKEAIQKLREFDIKKTDGSDFEEMDDIPEAQERKLIDTIDQIVFLTKFPIMTKAFYTASDSDPTRALAADVEFPHVGEIMGCSMRECVYEELKKKLKLFTLRDLGDEVIDLCSEKVELVAEIRSSVLSRDAEKLESILQRAVQSLITGFKPSPATDPTIWAKYKKIEKDITDIPYEKYQWYFDLRRYGSGKTGGFGLGVERLICWLAGADSVKHVTMWPRFDGQLTP